MSALVPALYLYDIMARTIYCYSFFQITIIRHNSSLIIS